jgi:hypothetical protein
MSIRRLLATTAAMAVAAVVLSVVTPDLSWLAGSSGDLQRAVHTAGADAVLLAGVAALAWATWTWGLLGLLLTALSVLPGVIGSLARVVAGCLLPAGARRAAALALGVGLATGTPVLVGCAASPTPAAVDLADSSTAGPVQDWPADGPVADWPAGAAGAGGAPEGPAAPDPVPVPDRPLPAPGEHVVLRGDCLWDIAADDLRRRTGHDPTDGAVAAAVRTWWLANTPVIGPDPDLLLPGQVLRPPPAL